jgi:hypothetical protein
VPGQGVPARVRRRARPVLREALRGGFVAACGQYRARVFLSRSVVGRGRCCARRSGAGSSLRAAGAAGGDPPLRLPLAAFVAARRDHRARCFIAHHLSWRGRRRGRRVGRSTSTCGAGETEPPPMHSAPDGVGLSARERPSAVAEAFRAASPRLFRGTIEQDRTYPDTAIAAEFAPSLPEVHIRPLCSMRRALEAALSDAMCTRGHSVRRDLRARRPCSTRGALEAGLIDTRPA